MWFDTVYVEVTGTIPTGTGIGDPTINTAGDFLIDNLMYIIIAGFVIIVVLAAFIYSKRKK